MRPFKGLILWIVLLSACSKDNSEKEIDIQGSDLIQKIIAPAKAIKAKISPISAEAYGQQRDYDYKYLDEAIRLDIQAMDSIYKSTPYYGQWDNSKYFVVSNSSPHWRNDDLDSTTLYGIANSDYNLILPIGYQTIHNPGLTLNNSLELSKNGLKGFFHLDKWLLLEPQFEMILPDGDIKKSKAYGLKDYQWYEISAENLSVKPIDYFNLQSYAKVIPFELDTASQSLMYNSYAQFYPSDPYIGHGVYFPASHVSDLDLSLRDQINDILLLNHETDRFGTESVKLKVKKQKKLSDRVLSFFVEILDKGVDARGYRNESTDLVTVNIDQNKVYSEPLSRLTWRDYFCRQAEYRHVNDSIAEVVLNQHSADDEPTYRFATKFNLYRINKDGSIVKLNTNRQFNATKYVLLEDRHFEGCFAKEAGQSDSSRGIQMIRTSHLSIEDLDLMRNEIFADYGYKFKTEKWQAYFSTKSWYKPLYDDVNQFLTDIDKANVQIILRKKEEMETKGDELLNPVIDYYAIAG